MPNLRQRDRGRGHDSLGDECRMDTNRSPPAPDSGCDIAAYKEGHNGVSGPVSDALRIDHCPSQLDRCEDTASSAGKLEDLSAGLDVFHKATLDMFQEPIVRALPNVLVEYFNFDRPIVSGLVHSLPELSQFDDTIAHHGAAH